MNPRIKATIFSTMIAVTVISILSSTGVALSYTEDINHWNGTGGVNTTSWTVDGVNDFLTDDGYAFNKMEPIDYADTHGTNPYGPMTVPVDVHDGMMLSTWFDPNDPGIPFPTGGLPYPYWSDHQPVWSSVPPNVFNNASYMPYPDYPSFYPSGNVYTGMQLTSYWNVTNDTEHVHYPEWTEVPFLPSVAPPPIIPYSITDIAKPLPSLSYSGWNFFSPDYDGVKFWMKFDAEYARVAAQLHEDAEYGMNPFQDAFGLTDTMTYLELGHVSLIEELTGFAPLNLGFVVDPANASRVIITDSSFLTTTRWAISPYPPGVRGLIPLHVNGPLPFVNPAVNVPGLPPQQPVPSIVDIVAQPTDFLEEMRSYYFAAGNTDYDLFTDMVMSIREVIAANGSVIDPSKYSLLAPVPPEGNKISFVGNVFGDGEVFTVRYAVNQTAGIATIETDRWYQLEVNMRWNGEIDWMPTMVLTLRDHDGFVLGSWYIQTPIDGMNGKSFWQTNVPDMFYAQFACPVRDGFGVPLFSTEQPLLGIDDVKSTTEVNMSVMKDAFEYVHCKQGIAGWGGLPLDIPVDDVPRSVSTTFMLEYPPDEDTMYDPRLSADSLMLFEFADPLHGDQFVWVACYPIPVPPLDMELQDVSAGSDVVHALFVMDGSTPFFSSMVLFTMNLAESIQTTITVEFLPDTEWNDYNITITGEYLSLPGPPPQFESASESYSGQIGWPNHGADRIGNSALSCVIDGGYNVTTIITDVSYSWEDVPPAPVMNEPDVEMYNDLAYVTFSWNATGDVDGYIVYYRFDGDGTVYGHVINDPGETEYEYIVYEDTTMHAWVVATNETGTSDASNNVSVTVDLPELAKTNVTVTSELFDGNKKANITVSWDAVDGAEYYKVWKNTSASLTSWTVVANTTDTTVNFTVTQNGTYYYRVVSLVSDPYGGMPIESDPSDHEFVTITLIYPQPPGGVASNIPGTDGVVRLTWNAVPTADHYLIYMSNATPVVVIPGNLVGNTTGTSFNYTVNVTGTYYFLIVAVDENGGTSTPSGTLTVVVTVGAQSFLDWLIEFILGIILSIVAFVTGLLGIAVVKTRRLKRACPAGTTWDGKQCKP